MNEPQNKPAAGPEAHSTSPRTDAVFLASMNPVVDAKVALDRMETHARALELETAAAQEQIKALTEQNAQLRAALTKITWVKLSWNGCNDCQEIARSALAASAPGPQGREA